jgi:hypothetical protein
VRLVLFVPSRVREVRLSRAGRVTVCLLLAVLAAVATVPLALPASAGSGLTRLQGKLNLELPADATGELGLAIDSIARRLIAFIAVGDGTLVQSYDIDRFKRVASRKLEHQIPGGLPVVDETSARVFAPFTRTNPVTRIPDFGGVLVLNTRTLATVAEWPAPNGLPPSGMTARPVIWGFRLSKSPTGAAKLLWLYQDEAALAAFARLVQNPVFVAQWDATTGAHEWAYQVRACRGEMNGGDWGLFRDATAMHIGCVTPENTGVAVRLVLPPSGPPTAEEVFSGPPLVNHLMADEAGRRLIFASEKDFKESLLPYDVDRASFVGAIATTRFRPAGASYEIDQRSGRLFGITSDKGVVLADVRRTPAQQALTFPAFARPGGAAIAVDPETPTHARRFFARLGSDDYVQAFEDRITVSEDPTLSELDRFTVDHAEAPGVTESGFEASGRAFGLRALFVAGIEGLGPGEVRRTFRRAGSPCSTYDRELVAGFVPETQISNGTAAAAAIAGDADPGTKIDVSQPVFRCWAHPDPLDTGIGLLGDGWPGPGTVDSQGTLDKTIGRQWPFERLECSGDENPDALRNGTFDGFVADVSCNGEFGVATAFAQSRFQLGSADSPAVRVADAGSRTDLQRRKAGGVSARSEAWSRGIEIAGVGTIELVRTVAVSQAAGLPGTAKGSFVREICGVSLGTFTQRGCDHPEEAVAAVNRALGARGRLILRRPDPELAKGSPGGYLASVRKDRFEELSDRALNNDGSTQVTGLELLLINDNLEFGRARQVFQFAGVDASASYGIFLLPTPQPPPPLPPFVPPVVPPVVGTPPAPPSPPAQPTTTIREITRRVANGFAVAFRDPVEAALAAITWLTLGLPLYLARRRGSLGRALRRSSS